jgi:kynurenine formamidase
VNMRIVDLSVPLENDVAADPPGFGPAIQYLGHKDTISSLQMAFTSLKPEDLPDGEGWAIEAIKLSTHNGTHLDAPWHYASTMDNGKLDFHHLPDGHVVSAQEVEDELTRIGHMLKPLDIVLVNTAAGARYGQADYVNRGCGMGREATLYLTSRGVRVTGTDGWSWDAPFVHTVRRFATTGDASIIWEGHKASREIGYCHIEKLHNLESLPANGFLVACFPVKIRAASAGWTRAVAILEGDTP